MTALPYCNATWTLNGIPPEDFSLGDADCDADDAEALPPMFPLHFVEARARECGPFLDATARADAALSRAIIGTIPQSLSPAAITAHLSSLFRDYAMGGWGNAAAYAGFSPRIVRDDGNPCSVVVYKPKRPDHTDAAARDLADAFGPLDELRIYLRDGLPPLSWVVAHAPDGRLDAVWSRAPWRVRLWFVRAVLPRIAARLDTAWERSANVHVTTCDCSTCDYATGRVRLGRAIARKLLAQLVPTPPTLEQCIESAARVRERTRR